MRSSRRSSPSTTGRRETPSCRRRPRSTRGTTLYESLRDVESERLKVFDGEFKAVTKLRAQIDRRCLYATAGDERSLCVDKGIEINRKVKGLQARRAKAANAVERYDRMIAWCASYKNWFC